LRWADEEVAIMSYRGRVVAGVIVLVLSLCSVSSAVAATVTKPSGDLISARLKALEWRPLDITPSQIKVVTTPSVLVRVRALINALPVAAVNPHQVCPMDMILVPSLNFATSLSAPIVTRVVFQLGGCPQAQVYQYGKKVSPALGGPNIAAVYYRIRQLITPHGVSMK
jgi:hypothetical protein